MVGYAVRASGIVIHQAEIVVRPRNHLCQLTQVVETVGQRARGGTGSVAVRWYGLGRLAVYEGAGGGVEGGGGVDAKDGREARGVYPGGHAPALDGVLDPVEEEGLAEEFEEVALDGFGDVGLEIEEVEIRFVVYRSAF